MKIYSLSVIVLCLFTHLATSATWTAEPEYAPQDPYSLQWCVQNAQNGDTIELVSGYHVGPIAIGKELTLISLIPHEAVISAVDCVMTVTGTTAQLIDIIIQSENPKHADPASLYINEATVALSKVVFRGGNQGKTLVINGNSYVSIDTCGFLSSPRDCLIYLKECPNNISTSDCQWPYSSDPYLERVIWDKLDDPTLGRVLR